MKTNRFFLLVLLITGLSAATVSAANLPIRATNSDDDVVTRSQVEEPSPLFAIVQKAERVVVLASQNRWADVRSNVQSLHQVWLDFEPLDPASVEPASMRHMEGAQAELEAVSMRQDQTATILAAHEVGNTAMDLYQLFHPTVPGAIQRLEEHEARALMDAALERPHSAHEVLDGADSVWHYFKPALIDHGGEDLALQFQGNLDLEHDYLDSHEYMDFKTAAESSLATLFQIGLLFD